MKLQKQRFPRIGVPWRKASEESANRRQAYDCYLRTIRAAGAEPVEMSLFLPLNELKVLAESLDGIVLSGSPADIEPRRFGALRHALTSTPDKRREYIDDFLLDHALETNKPLLAICFGIQSLNIHMGGTLVQDIPSELSSNINHDLEESGDARHRIRIEAGRLAKLAGKPIVRVNSSHHQSILKPGRGLRVTARSIDGVIEAVEWTGGPQWIIGVQWHPERMPDDPLAQSLFRSLVREAPGRNPRNESTPEAPSLSPVAFDAD